MKAVKRSYVYRFATEFNFRAAIYVACSIVANAALFVYSLICSLLYPESVEWYKNQMAFHLIFFIARSLLLLLHKRNIRLIQSSQKTDDKMSKSVCLMTALFLFIQGLDMIESSFMMYIHEIPVHAPTTFVIIHGYYILFRIIVSLMGKIRYSEPSNISSFLRCKKYLSRAESLFLIVIVENQLLTINKVTDSVLLITNLISGVAVGLYVIFLSTVLIYHGIKNS